jgi:hypothetical protein
MSIHFNFPPSSGEGQAPFDGFDPSAGLISAVPNLTTRLCSDTALPRPLPGGGNESLVDQSA